MRVKYNRVSTLLQTGNRFEADKEKYDMVFLDKISGSVSFKDRPKSKELIKLIEEGKISEIVVEEFSRLGRNTGDVIQTLEWLEDEKINVVVRNIGLQSRPNGKKNAIWKMISSVMSSLYEMELENILERTSVGRMVYLQNGGILGRPIGTNEGDSNFINKPKNKKALEYLKKGRTLREIGKILEMSTKTVMKVKKVAIKLEMI
ncbi:recombinase family protein [Chryseobacterium sp. AG363]|uniref:recombinase family protein n=1 Tax=Chryseobacterium sp. AG363 TaxID=2183997 RepID=UPI000E75451A|nr:recombinase family protein [Chryseobacterium sp. AG363]RKE77854.1 DNA invertase Pin-like site-specific DNA recombinase [Chryseobacterium sp. AG363]